MLVTKPTNYGPVLNDWQMDPRYVSNYHLMSLMATIFSLSLTHCFPYDGANHARNQYM